MRILLVEDETKLALLLQRGLREEGICAYVAPTGAEGLWLRLHQFVAFPALPSAFLPLMPK